MPSHTVLISFILFKQPYTSDLLLGHSIMILSTITRLFMSPISIYVEYIFHANNSDGNSIPREINSTDRNPKKISEKNIPLSKHEQFDCVRSVTFCLHEIREKKKSGEKYHAKVNLYAKNILHLLFFSVFIFFSVVTWAWQYRCFFFICMSLVVRVLSVCTRLVYPSALNFALCHSFVVYIGCAAELCACWHFGFWQ